MGARHGRVLLVTTTWLRELGPHHGRAAGASLPCHALPTFQLERGRALRRPRQVRPPRWPWVIFFTFLISEIEMHVVWIASIL